MSHGGHIETLIAEVKSQRILWDMRDKNYHNRYAVDEVWTQVAKVVKMSSSEAKAKWKSLRDSFRRELKKMPQCESEDNAKPWCSKWMYFNSMLFLRDVMKFKDGQGNDAKGSRHSSDMDDNQTNDSADCKESRLNGEDSCQKRSDSLFANRQNESQTLEHVTNWSSHNTDTGSRKRFASNDVDSSKNSRHCVSKLRKRHDRMDILERMIHDLELKKELLQNNEDDDDLSFFKSLLPYIRRLPPLKKLQIRSQYQTILINEINEMENKQNTATAFSNFTYPSSSSSSSSPSSSPSPSPSPSPSTSPSSLARCLQRHHHRHSLLLVAAENKEEQEEDMDSKTRSLDDPHPPVSNLDEQFQNDVDNAHSSSDRSYSIKTETVGL